MRLLNVPRTVWALGFVSMFMDISSEMIHSLLPVFLVVGLGASPALVGLIEGGAEATASITKVFSGWLSDRLGRRKILAVVGYGLGAITKPVFPLAVTPFEVLGARFADRIGKGIRGLRATRLSPMSRRRTFAAPHLACGSPWTPSAPSSAP